MDKVGLLARDAEDAEEFATKRGWSKVSFAFWRDELGRLVKVMDKADDVVKDCKLVIVTKEAYKGDKYQPILSRATGFDIPCTFE